MTIRFMNVVLITIIVAGIIAIGYLVYEIILLARKRSMEIAGEGQNAPEPGDPGAYERKLMENINEIQKITEDFREIVQTLNETEERPMETADDYRKVAEYSGASASVSYGNGVRFYDSEERTIQINVGMEGIQVYACLRFLTLAGKPTRRREFLMKQQTMLGRERSTDIAIDDPSVSKLHAVISVDQDGIWITDQKTTNGTWLGRERLTPMHKTLIHGGEVIKLGATTFTVDLPE